MKNLAIFKLELTTGRNTSQEGGQMRVQHAVDNVAICRFEMLRLFGTLHQFEFTFFLKIVSSKAATTDIF